MYLNILNIIAEIKQDISELTNNPNNIYSKALIKYYQILDLFTDNKIKFELFQINGNYYISETYIKLLTIQHQSIIKINSIINKILPNLFNISNILINNTKDYNNLDIKYIKQKEEIIKIINLKEFHFNDEILIKLINSHEKETDLIKYCGIFNYNLINYYKNIFKYILFSINEYKYENIELLTLLKKNKKLEDENIKNKELIIELNKKIEKIQLILDDYEYL